MGNVGPVAKTLGVSMGDVVSTLSLFDQNALKAIVDAGLGEQGTGNVSVLEIGPGLGVLTEEMLNRGCRVTAIEKDPVLAERLAASLGNPPNLTVIADDALAWLGKEVGESELHPRSPFPVPHFPT